MGAPRTGREPRRAGAARRAHARERFPRVAPELALLPLRLFLGVTFVYAGMQKLSDPGFLHPGAPTYIGTQLHAFANGTPGGFLLRVFALPAPKLTGVVTALVEIAVGLLTVGGLATRAAASLGLLLNLELFLTNSWKTSPYFLGSDIVFVFAWLPFVLAGATGQPALDNVIAAGRTAAAVTRPGGGGLTRRAAMSRALGAAGMATLALGGLAALLKGSYRPATRTLGAAPHGAPPAAGSTRPHRAQQPASVPSGAVRLGASNQLPPGQASVYTDPGDQQPDIVIRQANGSLTAFSAVCTHQGCTVGFQDGQILCPCHGGVYSAQTGDVDGGPPPAALPRRRVVEAAGSIYAVPD